MCLIWCIHPNEIVLDKDVSTALFRILQEVLTNIARHANATAVEIGLRRTNGKVTLEVKDNGCGILKEQIYNQQSLGILGMQERTLSCSGEFEMSGIPDKGTTLRVIIPLRRG